MERQRPSPKREGFLCLSRNEANKHEWINSITSKPKIHDSAYSSAIWRLASAFCRFFCLRGWDLPKSTVFQCVNVCKFLRSSMCILLVEWSIVDTLPSCSSSFHPADGRPISFPELIISLSHYRNFPELMSVVGKGNVYRLTFEKISIRPFGLIKTSF